MTGTAFRTTLPEAGRTRSLRVNPLILGLPFFVTACISPVDYGKVRHADYVADERCDPAPNENQTRADAPFFVVTSRLPDCRTQDVKLINHRGDKVRYGRFGDPKDIAGDKGKAKSRIPFSLSDEEQWWSDLSKSMDNREGRALVYVHGYRETFHTSSLDTAQMARLTGFTGPVIQYSWPSQGRLLKYVVDETNMYWDVYNFRRFLMKLAEQKWTREIVLISHSLGARLVIPAVEFVDKNSTDADSSVISNIILASPDIDRQDFEREIAEEILAARRINKDRRITVYASVKDKALGFSYRIHGYPRLGSPVCFDPFKAEELKQRGLPERCYAITTEQGASAQKSGLTIVDTTAVSAGGSGHSDYLRNAATCLDFAATVNGARDRMQGRQPTHLPHVYMLTAITKHQKLDHSAICRRKPIQ